MMTPRTLAITLCCLLCTGPLAAITVGKVRPSNALLVIRCRYGFIDIWSEGPDTYIRNNMKIAIDITYEVEAGAFPTHVVIAPGATVILQGVSESQLQIVAIQHASTDGAHH